MNTYTPRHTARPSRSRVIRARVSGFVDRHDDALTLAVVATIVVLVSALTAVALAQDYAVSTRDALAVAVLTVALGTLSGAFSYLVGSERASRRVSRRYSRYLNEQSDKYRDELERVTRERDDARRENSRTAYALLSALEQSDTH